MVAASTGSAVVLLLAGLGLLAFTPYAWTHRPLSGVWRAVLGYEDMSRRNQQTVRQLNAGLTALLGLVAVVGALVMML